MENSRHIVTLMTDFGTRDYFVAAMKGVMLSINPNLEFIDIAHDIPPHDVATGAFTLGQAYAYFPARTIHLAVVDPGVGTARKALVASGGGQQFVAPDNGLLTHVLEREPEMQVHEIIYDHFFRKPVSSTFHGRDIFAPAAAYLSKDVTMDNFGPVLDKPVRLPMAGPKRVRENLIQAAILTVDQFGNLVTNLKQQDLPVYSAESRPCKILAGKREIASFRRTFSEGNPGDVFVVPGSTGYLEIAVQGGSAASVLQLGAGSMIGVVIG